MYVKLPQKLIIECVLFYMALHRNYLTVMCLDAETSYIPVACLVISDPFKNAKWPVLGM